MTSRTPRADPAKPTSEDTSLSPQAYLQKHQVNFYLRDVVGLLLRARDERPLDFIADYFAEVLNGTHVLLREFAYVNRCARDRWAFVASAREALADLDQCALTTSSTLTQLLRLVCPDFPHDIAANACRLCGDEGSPHPLDRLLHATCVRICFADMLNLSVEVFRTCDARAAGRVDRVVIGHALRQALNMLSEGCPPTEVFDELTGTPGDIGLAELQHDLVHSQHMYALFEQSNAAGTLVASPPAREAAISPGTTAASALATSLLAAGRRGRGQTASRERLADAAATAASAGAGGGRRASFARQGSAKNRRQAGLVAARIANAGPPPSTSAR